MIVLSLVLVIVAAVALIAGFFQPDSLTLIWVSIGACVTAMLFLGIGVLQRKRSTPATSGGYGPGAGNAPVRPSGSAAPSRPAPREASSEESRSARPAAEAPAAEPAPAAPVPAPADTDTDEETVIVRKASARKGAVKKKVVARKASKKATEKKAATKKASKKKATTRKTTPRQASKKKATTRTTGAEARAALAEVRGVGPAKQDALLARFGSLEKIRAASPDEIATVKGIGPTLATAIKDELS